MLWVSIARRDLDGVAIVVYLLALDAFRTSTAPYVPTVSVMPLPGCNMCLALKRLAAIAQRGATGAASPLLRVVELTHIADRLPAGDILHASPAPYLAVLPMRPRGSNLLYMTPNCIQIWNEIPPKIAVGAVLGHLGDILGPFQAILGTSSGHFGQSWTILGQLRLGKRSGRGLGGGFGVGLGGVCGVWGASWELLGGLWGGFEGSWERLWRYTEHVQKL